MNAVKRALGLGGTMDGMQARAPEAAGKYRPVYALSDADLSQRTADIIAGEAIRRNPESIDAVINNMMNRVGSKGWGPSKNLLEVATAPGQYEAAWKGSKANASETEFIRSRILAIASGGVPDNTNGSNAYRAGSYRGPWYQKHRDAPVIGGNRFAYEPGALNGPYAPYRDRADAPEGPPAPRFGTTPNTFNPRDYMRSQPMGSTSTSNDNSRTISQKQPGDSEHQRGERPAGDSLGRDAGRRSGARYEFAERSDRDPVAFPSNSGRSRYASLGPRNLFGVAGSLDGLKDWKAGTV